MERSGIGNTLHCHVLRWRRQERFVPNPITPRRLAAARRAVNLDKDKNALTPELVKYGTPEERLEALAEGLVCMEREWRQRRANAWRECRKRLAALPPLTRRGVVCLWNKGIYPLEPSYLACCIREAEQGQSPWAKLTRLRRLELIGAGRLPRPKHWTRYTENY
jgi:hypothetical protein